MSYKSAIGSPVDELKSTRIWLRLQSINPERAREMVAFVEAIAPHLNSITNFFPLYTRHDCHHSYEVLERLSDITRPELLNEQDSGFSDDEIVCLIVSAYAHDVGMCVFETGDSLQTLSSTLGLPFPFNPDDERVSTYLRRNHAERSADYIQTSAAGKFVPEYLKGIIGQIIKGHNYSPEQIRSQIPEEAAIGRKSSNPQALTILLCCGDLLEFSDTRVLDSAFSAASIRKDSAAELSLMEMRKHRAVGCGLAVNAEGLIIASGNFTLASTLHATHGTLDSIENWLAQYLVINSRLRKPVLRIANSKILRDSFYENGFRYFPVAITLDDNHIRQIFTGKQLWRGDIGLPVRELIQNSIDACRYKSHISPASECYMPSIKVVFNFEKRMISITDNGIGMNSEDIVKYFLQIGKSKAREPHFVTNPKNVGFSPISTFGVGFWSIFSLANEVLVTTKINQFEQESDIGFAFSVRIEPILKYLELKTRNDLAPGTTIDIFLKDEVSLLGLLQNMYKLVRASAIPISFVSEKGETLHNFPSKLDTFEDSDILGYRVGHWTENGLKIYSKDIDTDELEIRLAIAYSMIGGKPRCLTPNGLPMFHAHPAGEGFHFYETFLHGFNTRFSLDHIPIAISRVGRLSVNIKNISDIEFSFDKNTLCENQRLKDLKGKISGKIANAITEFFKDVGIIDDPDAIGTLIADTRMAGGEAGDNRIDNHYKILSENYYRLSPIHLIEWDKAKKTISRKFIFWEDFWKLDEPIPYICCWPPSNDADYGRIHKIVADIANSTTREHGFLLLASEEAGALVDIAKSLSCRSFPFYYKNWNSTSNEYLEIVPNAGYSGEELRILFNIQSSWTGTVSQIEFLPSRNTKPWFSFGRYRMFVDSNHAISDYLANSYKLGDIVEVGKLLAIMAANDESALFQIQNITKIKMA